MRTGSTCRAPERDGIRRSGLRSGRLNARRRTPGDIPAIGDARGAGRPSTLRPDDRSSKTNARRSRLWDRGTNGGTGRIGGRAFDKLNQRQRHSGRRSRIRAGDRSRTRDILITKIDPSPRTTVRTPCSARESRTFGEGCPGGFARTGARQGHGHPASPSSPLSGYIPFPPAKRTEPWCRHAAPRPDEGATHRPRVTQVHDPRHEPLGEGVWMCI